MKVILRVLFFVAIIFNLILSSWFVLHHDVVFSAEVARDFFLLDELHQKKIVLIGPSSTTGLFHGPLWTYLNYPAYVLGGGNPVFVGWGWIAFVLFFLISGFYIAKKLFDSRTAYLFTLMNSVYMVFHAKNFYNPHGAMLLLPALFFFFIRYLQTLRLKYLIVHILISGAVIQFQMAIGVPFFILSFLYAIYITIKKHKISHLLAYGLILLTLINFIVFDLRHDFLLLKKTGSFLTSAGRDQPEIVSMFKQRIQFMTTGVEFLRTDPGYRDLVIFLIFACIIFIQVKDKKYRTIYLSFLYFYFGYLILSNLNAGGLLYFYLFPLFPFVFLIFSSGITSRFKKSFTVLFFIIFFMNVANAIQDTKAASSGMIGKDENSWLFLKNMASDVFSGKENEFGYFVYSPDIVGYKPKYAMRYMEKRSTKKTYYFQKKQVTYLVIAPPAKGNPYMEDSWWRINLLHIKKEPESVKTFPNGYKIERYLLSKEDIAVAVEPNIDPGIFFR